jgi:hypothetical protein
MLAPGWRRLCRVGPDPHIRAVRPLLLLHLRKTLKMLYLHTISSVPNAAFVFNKPKIF